MHHRFALLCSSPQPPLPLYGEDGAQRRLPHHPLLPRHNRGSPPHFVCWVRRALALSPSSPQRGTPPLWQGWSAWGLFPLSLPGGALPTTTSPPGRCSSSPKGRCLALLHSSLGRGLCPGPFSTSVPSARRRFPPFPLGEGLRLLHSAARQAPSMPEAPGEGGLFPSPPAQATAAGTDPSLPSCSSPPYLLSYPPPPPTERDAAWASPWQHTSPPGESRAPSPAFPPAGRHGAGGRRERRTGGRRPGKAFPAPRGAWPGPGQGGGRAQAAARGAALRERSRRCVRGGNGRA